jgi:thiamine biosynthesis lipoprotein
VIVAPPAPRLVVPEEVGPDALKGFDPAAAVVDFAGETMGTRWHVRLALPRGRSADALGPAIQSRLDEIVAQMSHWDPASQLCRFNAAKGGSWVDLPRDFARVMHSALVIAERSRGAFDPACGRLTDVWGLGPRQVEEPPAPAELAEALAHSGWEHLAFDAAASRLRQPGGVWLDLSGIAKGFAADAVAQRLVEHGVHHALVEVGGECVGRGMRPDGDPWWVDVESPPGFGGRPLRVALHQLALATSGDYLRGGHTIDPTSGRPAIHQTTAVSVLGASCMEADAWATALSVPRPEIAQELATRWKLMVRLLTRGGDEWLSPALQALML